MKYREGYKYQLAEDEIFQTAITGFTLIILTVGLLLAVALLGSGCTVTKYVAPTGESFTRTSFGTKLSANEISVTITTNGTRSMSIRGYANDQVQAIGVAVDAAVTAAVKSMKP